MESTFDTRTSVCNSCKGEYLLQYMSLRVIANIKQFDCKWCAWFKAWRTWNFNRARN